MYYVYCDDFTMLDTRLENYTIFNPRLELELNKTGSFTFTIYPDHVNYNRIIKMKSIVKVYQDTLLVFQGRVLNTEEGFYNEMQVTCEGELAFFIDSIIRPYGSETEPWVGTPKEYLTKLINEHNEQVDLYKRFKVGTVNVPSGNETGNITRSDSEYKTTWDLINEKLISALGGYLWVRHEADGTYIDYLEDINILATQKIEFGKNLMDIIKTTKGEDAYSAIIPLGAVVDENPRITIASVNNGVDWLANTEAVAAYGYIFKTVIWDDVTEPSNLLTKAQAYISNQVGLTTSIQLTAADLAGIEEVNSFMLGRKVKVRDSHHNFNEAEPEFLIKKISIDLLNPASNTLVVNDTFETFTQSTTTAEKIQGQVVEKVGKIEKEVQGYVTTDSMREAINEAKTELIEQNSSSIIQTSTDITTQVAQDYYLKDDADKLVASINTQFEQTDNEFEFRFNEFIQDLDAVQSGADAKFSEINKYIRFVDGDILLGEDGNILTLRIQNDRISFMEDGVEVAYFSNRKLFVLDGEFINSLKLGNFAFIPRSNGNLSFKKI